MSDRYFLSGDVARCLGTDCPIRQDCKRYRTSWSQWQPVFALVPWDGAACRELLPVEELGAGCGEALGKEKTSQAAGL